MSTQKKKSVQKKASPGEHTHASAADATLGNLCQSALFGALIGLLAAALLLFAATAIGYATADPCALTKPLALAALYLSSLVAGFAALRRNRSMALLCGTLCGLFLMLVFWILARILGRHIEPSFAGGTALLLRLLMLPIATVGGFLGLPKNTKKRPRTR